jgi:transposase
VLREQGHQVRLIPAQFVKPYRKSNKNDFRDAKAIAEAVTKENMRFVQIKSEDQLDLQAMHRVRDRLVQRRTALINEIRGFLLASSSRPSPSTCATTSLEWKQIESDVQAISHTIERISDEDVRCRLLRQIPGFRPLVFTAVAAIGNGAAFRRGPA